MTQYRALRKVLLLTVAAVVLGGHLDGQTSSGTAPLSVEEVVKLRESGLSEEVVITKIKKNGKAFDLSTEELLELKKSGVTDNIIKYLLDPTQPYAPPAPAPPPVPAPAPDASTLGPPKSTPPAKQYPEDAFVSSVPPEPGLYRFLENAPQRAPDAPPAKIDLKMLLGVKQSAGLGKVLLRKPKTIAYLVGPASKNRISNPAPVFYLRLPGKGIEEVVLVALDPKSDRREIEMQKEELKSSAMRQFDQLEVGAGLFRISSANLGKGEFLFFLVGSGEPAKGNFGKGYDFGIEDPGSK